MLFKSPGPSPITVPLDSTIDTGVCPGSVYQCPQGGPCAYRARIHTKYGDCPDHVGFCVVILSLGRPTFVCFLALEPCDAHFSPRRHRSISLQTGLHQSFPVSTAAQAHRGRLGTLRADLDRVPESWQAREIGTNNKGVGPGALPLHEPARSLCSGCCKSCSASTRSMCLSRSRHHHTRFLDLNRVRIGMSFLTTHSSPSIPRIHRGHECTISNHGPSDSGSRSSSNNYCADRAADGVSTPSLEPEITNKDRRGHSSNTGNCGPGIAVWGCDHIISEQFRKEDNSAGLWLWGRAMCRSSSSYSDDSHLSGERPNSWVGLVWVSRSNNHHLRGVVRLSDAVSRLTLRRQPRTARRTIPHPSYAWLWAAFSPAPGEDCPIQPHEPANRASRIVEDSLDGL